MELSRWLRNHWDRVVAVVIGLLGLLSLYLGYRGTAGSGYPAEQIPYLASGGLVGIFLLGVGATIWLSADLRDDWRKVHEVGELLRDGLRESAAEVPTRASNGGRLRAPGDDVHVD